MGWSLQACIAMLVAQLSRWSSGELDEAAHRHVSVQDSGIRVRLRGLSSWLGGALPISSLHTAEDKQKLIFCRKMIL